MAPAATASPPRVSGRLGVTTCAHLTALRPGLPQALPSPEELQREFAEAEREVRDAADAGPSAGPRAAD